jgi:hypothetical protein
MRALLLLALASPCLADPPFYPRGTQTNQAIGAMNQNWVDQTTQQANHLTTTITPPSCSTGAALTGAYYSNGYTFGGVCQSVTASSGTWNGGLVTNPSTFTATVDFTSGTAVGSSVNGINGVTPLTTVWAQSADGATQSSGCVVALYMSANTGAASDTLVFSSTNSATAGAFGVLDTNSCAPGNICQVIIHGPARPTGITGNCAISNAVSTDNSVRCNAAARGTATTVQWGTCMTAGSPAWVWLP